MRIRQQWIYDKKNAACTGVMVMSDSQGELLSKITQILVRFVISSVKYAIFFNVYTTSLLKSSLCPPLQYLWVNDYKGKGISGHDYYNII